jgi:hypothetical protein
MIWHSAHASNQHSGPRVVGHRALCGHLVPAGSVYALLAEHRKKIFPDELFADLFESERGRPSVPTDVIAVAMVLKELEGLSDRQTATTLATDIRWKAAAGLALDDPGFHHTLLCRLRGQWPTWCVGAWRIPPFGAHAWVEADGVRSAKSTRRTTSGPCLPCRSRSRRVGAMSVRSAVLPVRRLPSISLSAAEGGLR